ncbi:ABC transporter ATP-binding protein, partial [[Ruminococcus] torques]
PDLNVYDNITFPLELDGTQIDKDFIQELLETLNISDKQEMLPAMLSGGEQQRVAIIRALATKPAIILADEPTGNLDTSTSHDVIGLLKMLSRQYQQTLIVITHDNDIAQMADRIVQIEDGKISTKGSDFHVSE